MTINYLPYILTIKYDCGYWSPVDESEQIVIEYVEILEKVEFQYFKAVAHFIGVDDIFIIILILKQINYWWNQQQIQAK